MSLNFLVKVLSFSFNILVLVLFLAVRLLAFLSHPKILRLLRLKAFFSLFPACTSVYVTNPISTKCVL